MTLLIELVIALVVLAIFLAPPLYALWRERNG